MILSFVKVKGGKVLPIVSGSIEVNEQNKNKTVWEVLTGLPRKSENATKRIRRRNV